ncbi:tRNA glutamyl-Q(34) synthetase GluQRS [Veillonella magna]|uniref:tRNA glutamyl-Q(34) synthetase GluQRS n=1 Tax=Veillonella magna TaxID=464322 RepID=UPI0023F3C437|nr:tRNA glutamyl-Q(34) synthetase GluQRS [Veillonella magna]MBD8976113.1 tRNA glutamyl-Q(34) synthetase GluQRS [Veillonella magna]
MKGRFAPSPTGHIHLGNAWIAMLSYISTRQQQGSYVLRMEDIDYVRAKRSLGEDLLDDLEWLGFDWDEGPRTGGPDGPYWQSERYDRYTEILDAWQEKGRIYPCYCNRARLQSIASAPHPGEPPHSYDGHCRHLSADERKALCSKKDPSWRLCCDTRSVYFNDTWQGPQLYELQAATHDCVVRRADGMFAYNLAVVLDDAAMGVTEIVRGYDLLDSTPIQLYIYDVLGKEPPIYKHAPLIVDSEGYRLSKRQQSITIRELKASGFSAAMIWGRLALLGGLVDESMLGPHRTITLAELRNMKLNFAKLKCPSIRLTNFDIKV